MATKITQEEYIRRVKEIYGDTYDLNNVSYEGKRQKISVVCPKHGVFEIYPMNFLKGVGCLQCFYEAKHRNAMIQNIEKAKQIHNNYYDYSLVDLDKDNAVTIICPIHGEFQQNMKDHLQGHGCPLCAYETISEKKKIKYTYEQLVNDGCDVHQNKYTYPVQDVRYLYDECTITCPIHGEFKQKINSHINERKGCPKCGLDKFIGSQKYDLEKVNDLIKSNADKFKDIEFDILSYEKMTKPMEFKCKICGGVFKRPLTVFINENNKCIHCSKEESSKQRCKTTEEFINEANKVHNNFYDYSCTHYTKSKNYVEIICPEHGKFSIEANSHLQGHGCPLHYCNKSKAEEEIANFIIDLVGAENVMLNTKQVLNSKRELDIFIPNYNLAVEFNGLFWHNELNKPNNYHLDKTNECKTQGIHLFHIFEDEWKYKKNIVMSMIKNKLNLTENKIYARQCVVKEVDFQIAKTFLESNHLQGNCSGAIRIGLYHKNELLSLMVFGKTRHFVGNNKDGYELLRFCNKINTNVVGGASKLFKFFIKKHNPTEIISYADKRWSTGGVYDKLNFTLYNESKPSYYYIIGEKRVYRYNLRKNILIKKFNCPKDKTEREFCREQKWYRIYDCGCLCYRWTNET